jgi:hypothetical protein
VTASSLWLLNNNHKITAHLQTYFSSLNGLHNVNVTGVCNAMGSQHVILPTMSHRTELQDASHYKFRSSSSGCVNGQWTWVYIFVPDAQTKRRRAEGKVTIRPRFSGTVPEIRQVLDWFFPRFVKWTNAIWKTGNRDSSVGIATGYGVPYPIIFITYIAIIHIPNSLILSNNMDIKQGGLGRTNRLLSLIRQGPH